MTLSDTILTSADGFCVSQTTTTVDASWVTPEMMEKWAKETEARIAERREREAEREKARLQAQIEVLKAQKNNKRRTDV